MDFSRARQRMVDVQIEGRGIHDEAVLAAMREVPRERFVGPGMEAFSYDDRPLPIGEAQTISQPYIVALMVEAAGVRSGDRVLDVGAGSGYASAILGRIAADVFAVERIPSLAHEAQRRFDALGYGNIHLEVGDGSRGWPEQAPFDAILVAAGAPDVPPALLAQLTVGGRLVLPIGAAYGAQRLRRIVRVDAHRYEQEDLGGVAFVPLIGEQGWPED